MIMGKFYSFSSYDTQFGKINLIGDMSIQDDYNRIIQEQLEFKHRNASVIVPQVHNTWTHDRIEALANHNRSRVYYEEVPTPVAPPAPKQKKPRKPRVKKRKDDIPPDAPRAIRL